MTSASLTNAAFDAFADDLLREGSPRTLIIIGATKLDDLLYQILNQYLLPKKSRAKDKDELLEGDRPLATFSARIKLSYRLGIIGDTLYDALEKLRSLRNPSAHSLDFDILKPPVRETFAEFRKSIRNRRSFRLTQERYFQDNNLKGIQELQCLLLTLCVLLEAVRQKTTVTSGNKLTRNISFE